ncbi:hypothetical protein SPB21_32365 [Leptothoe sp. ISB3NOV94-8A]|uniref:hypothetical protein n=1 Tax=Adonisia turfae TaxID=2950184 RepID=UPI0013CFCAF7|nr:hypothetical protein [Adonisia turfae]MDV3353045.1 hypothetical protein [Leptothoe sp. LEGE 181152]
MGLGSWTAGTVDHQGRFLDAIRGDFGWRCGRLCGRWDFARAFGNVAGAGLGFRVLG